MTRAVIDWAGPDVATVASYAARYKRALHPGEVTCGGEVSQVADDKAHLQLWARNSDGDVVTTAKMVLSS